LITQENKLENALLPYL